MKNHEFQELVDQNLSELVWDERKRQKVLHAISKEEKPMRKISTTFVLIAAIVCLSVTALAAGLIFSPGYDAVHLANQALKDKYNLTDELQSIFYRTSEEQADGSTVVTYTIFEPRDFPAEQIGTYTVTVKGNHAEAVWSHDGDSTEGGLEAKAFTAEQLTLIANDYSGTLTKMMELGVWNPDAVTQSGTHRSMEGVNPEEETTRYEQERLTNLALAESKGTISIEEAANIARSALEAEYPLTKSQLEKLSYEPSMTFVSENSDTCVAIMYWLWQSEIEGGERTEMDGQYWVTIDLKDGVIMDVSYDSGLMGNG